MTFQEIFREEFYEELKDYSAYAVIKTINLMSKARMASFYSYYKKGSSANLNSNVAKELIENLKKSIDENFAKKRFSQVLNYRISSIKQKFGELSLNAQVSLLKEYTFNSVSTEYKRSLSEDEIEANRIYLKQLEEMIKSNITYYKGFYENFRVPREILLLAVILLDEKDKKSLVLKYDEDLCRKNSRKDVGSEVSGYVYFYVIPRIRKNVNYIYDFIPTNLLETLKSMLSLIETSQIFTNQELVDRIITLIGDYVNKANIYDIFPDDSIDILNEFLNRLSKREIALLAREYSFGTQERKKVVSDEVRKANRETLNKLKSWIDTYQKYTNFEHFFTGQSDNVESLIEQLNDKDKEFLASMYNQGYMSAPNIDMIIYKTNIDRLEIIIRKIQYNLNVKWEIPKTSKKERKSKLTKEKIPKLSEEKVVLTIFDIVRVKDLNVIKTACIELCILDYMRILFGENLDKEFEISVSSLSKFMTSSVIYRLNSQIENKTRQKQSISIYEYYITFKRDNETVQEFKSRVNNVIRKIDSRNVKTILFNRFYDDVKDLIDVQDIDITNNNTNLSDANAMITKRLALQNLYYARERGLDYKAQAFDKRGEFLVERFYNGVVLDDIKRELALFNERTIGLFKLKYGENLDELGKVGIFSSKDLELMQRAISKINKKLYLKDLLLNALDKFRTTVEFATLIEQFSEAESLIIMSGKYFSGYLDTQDIIDYLEATNSLRRMQ